MSLVKLRAVVLRAGVGERRQVGVVRARIELHDGEPAVAMRPGRAAVAR